MPQINTPTQLFIRKAINILMVFIILISTATLLAIYTIKNNLIESNKNIAQLLIRQVNAKEIYSEFICGCCGKTLNPDDICCGDMQQKINFINTQINNGLNKKQTIFTTAKQFGINSLAQEKTKISVQSQLAAMAPANAPQITLSQTNQNLGTISQKDGTIFTLFDLENTGLSNLTINKLNTSCGCTSASIIYKDKEGPIFTMPGHGKKNQTNWQISIAPGDTAQIKVYYDPNAHGPQKQNTQSITRTISIFSNDPINFEKQIKIELNQTP